MAGGVEHAGWEVACPVDRMHGEWCGPIRPPADVPPLPDEVERLREALRPFAAAARQISPGAGDDTRVYSGGLTAGHYRRARAALEDRR